MIISESLNCVFIHIPKTGGTSMHAMVAPALDLSRDLDVISKKQANGNRAACGIDPDAPLVIHSPVRRLRKLLGTHKFDQMFSFAMVRNPFARAYSAFTFVQYRALHHVLPEVREFRAPFLDLTFDDIAADLPKYVKSIGSLRPQTLWVPNPAKVSFVGRLENFENDWTHIRDTLGIAHRTTAIPRRENVTRKRPEWMTMSDAAAAHVAEYYAEDFTTFGYEPHLPSIASEVA